MNITKERLKEIIKQELEGYMLEEGIMDLGKKVGKKAKAAMAGAALAGALAGSPSDAAAKEPAPVAAQEKAPFPSFKDWFKKNKSKYATTGIAVKMYNVKKAKYNRGR